MTHCLFNLVVAVLLVLALLSPGCSDTGVAQLGQADRPLPQERSQDPFMFVYRFASFSPTAKYGVVAAVWQDGTVVRATGEDHVGEAYVRGRVSPEQLVALRRTLSRSGLLESISEQPRREHQRRDSLWLRWGDEYRDWKHYRLDPEDMTEGGATTSPVSTMTDTLLTVSLHDQTPELDTSLMKRYPKWWLSSD